jgi:hypothetical protein
MRILRAVAGATLGLTVLAVPSAGAADQALAGTTVIAVSRPAYIDVRLPRQVALRTPFDDSPDIAVSGGAALAAFVLTGTDARTRSMTLTGGASTVEGSTERFLFPAGTLAGGGGGHFEDWKTFSNTTTLPAGRYRLYVVATGPATITLRLPGLAGRTRLAPSRAAAARVEAPDREVTVADASNNVYAAATNVEMARRGFALHLLHSRLEAEAAWQVVMCHNNPGQSAAAELRDAPGCPAGKQHTVVNHRYPGVEPETKLLAQGFTDVPAGEHGLGVVQTVESYSTANAYRTVWVEY